MKTKEITFVTDWLEAPTPEAKPRVRRSHTGRAEGTRSRMFDDHLRNNPFLLPFNCALCALLIQLWVSVISSLCLLRVPFHSVNLL